MLRLALSLLLTGCGAPAAPAPLAPHDVETQQDTRDLEADLVALADRAADRPDIAAPALFRAAAHAVDAEAPSRARQHLERLVRDYPASTLVPAALLQLAYTALDTGDDNLQTASLLSLLCPERVPDPFARPIPDVALDGCRPRPLAQGLFHAWFLLGEHDFDRAELDRAAHAYERALELAPDEPLRARVTYKLAWTHYRADRYAQAMMRFEALLGSEERLLASESATYIAMCISEPDWDGDGAGDPVSGLARPEVQAWLARTPSPVVVLQALVGVERDQARCDEARAALRALAARDPSAAAEVEPTLARCAPR